MTDLAPLRVFLACKDAAKNEKNFNEIIFYLKIQYLPHNDEWRTFIEDIPNKEDWFPFEEKSGCLKNFSKSMKEVENMSLNNKVSLGGWISTAVKVFRRDKNMRRENLPGWFDDWMYRECRMKKKTINNYKHLYKLMRIAPKLMNSRVNMAYFVKNHDILMNYFEENEEQPWIYSVSCDCEACNSYFTEQTMI